MAALGRATPGQGHGVEVEDHRPGREQVRQAPGGARLVLKLELGGFVADFHGGTVPLWRSYLSASAASTRRCITATSSHRRISARLPARPRPLEAARLVKADRRLVAADDPGDHGVKAVGARQPRPARRSVAGPRPDPGSRGGRRRNPPPSSGRPVRVGRARASRSRRLARGRRRPRSPDGRRCARPSRSAGRRGSAGPCRR